jgi:integrase
MEKWRQVYGPYRERGGWRVVYVDQGGGRSSKLYKTEARAKAVIKKAQERLAIEGVTVSDLVDRYADDQRARDLSEDTIERAGYAFKGILWNVYDTPIRCITKRRASKLYEARAEHVKSTTHLGDLNQVKMLFRWAVKKSLLPASPFENVEGRGQKDAGKLQLTIDEARIFVAHCLATLEDGPDVGATGALIALGLGLRSGEIRGLTPRDIDDGGNVLIVRKETSKGRKKKSRRLIIPAWLQPVITKDALPLLNEKGQLLSANGLLSRVNTLCRHAGVTVVCVHALRGTHSTLAASAGAASEYVAASLGHSVTMNKRHYSGPGSIESGTAKRAGLRLVK